MPLRFDPLDPIGKCGHAFDRSVAWLGSRPLVVVHKRGRSLTPSGHFDWPSLLQRYDFSPVVELEPSSWSWTKATTTDFNCHSLAIGSHVGIGPDAWLEGASSNATLSHNPTGVMLEHCFHRIDFGGAPRENDVVVYYDSIDDRYIHSVLLKRFNDEWLAVSKFGEGPILITTTRLIERFFAGQFDQLRCYRSVDQGASQRLCDRIRSSAESAAF